MSESEKTLSSKWVINPLVVSEGNESPVVRIFAQPQAAAWPYQGEGRADLLEMNVEFGTVCHGATMVPGSCHSYAMTADVMGLAPEMTKNLSPEAAQEMISKFETGEAFKAFGREIS